MAKEHGLLLFLPPELSMGLIKYQAAHELGRTYAGLSLVNESLFRNNCIAEDVYEHFRERYSLPLVPKAKQEPKILSRMEQQEKTKIARFEKQFSGALAQWETLSEKAKAAHILDARNLVGIVPNAKLILDMEDPLSKTSDSANICAEKEGVTE